MITEAGLPYHHNQGISFSIVPWDRAREHKPEIGELIGDTNIDRRYHVGLYFHHP